MKTRREFLYRAGLACGCAVTGSPLRAFGNPSDSPYFLDGFFCADGDKYGGDGIPETFAPAPEAVSIINRIARSVGISTDFVIREGRFTKGYNAVAGLSGTELVIIYDRANFSFTDGHISFANLATLAHEVGHHIHSHFLTGGSTPPKEIQADKFSGFSMGHMGLTLDQALTRARQYSEEGSETHPPRDARVQAVSDGWYAAVTYHRYRDVATCEPGWIGPEKHIGSKTCRIARDCGPNGPNVQVACKASPGQWVWTE
jgi:hypothetical protein